MELSLSISFIAGLVSFLSPCVLPIIPGFLAYLAGTTVHDSATKRRDVFLASLFFVLGFSTVFALLGVVLNTVLGSVATDAQTWLARIGGLIIIIFGIYLTGLIHLPFLEKEYKFDAHKTHFKSRLATSFVFGAAFAAGWTPCVGAVLGGILGLAAAQPGSAFGLLFTYALGLGVPFLVVGFFASQASTFIKKYTRAFGYVRIGFGILLIIVGILAFTENLSKLANFDFLNNLLLS